MHFNDTTEINVKACTACDRIYPNQSAFCDRCGAALTSKKEQMGRIREELVKFNQEWREDIDREIAEAEKALKEKKKGLGDIDEIIALYTRGYSLCELKRYDEGIECYDEILKHHPDNAKILIYKGSAYHSWEKYEKAIECYDKILETEPDNKEAWEYKGSALNKLGRYNEATECFNKAR